MAATTALVLSVVSAAASVVSLAMTLTQQNDTNKDVGSNINRKGADNPKIVAFGDCLVPAVRVWNNVDNNNTRWLCQAYSLGVGELMAVDRIYIDGVPYRVGATMQPDIWYGLGECPEFPNVSLGIRAGRLTEQAYPELIAHSDGEWSEACRGDKTASISMLIERLVPSGSDNNIRVMSDRLDVTALVKGNAVIDPRLDPNLDGAVQTNLRVWEDSERTKVYRNPACVLLTYLVDTYYGMGIPADAVDVKSFVDLANLCEKYEMYFDGYIDQSKTFGSLLTDMATSFDGIVYIEDGLVRVKSDRPSLPVAHITDGDCVGAFRLSNANDSGYFNIVNVSYSNTSTHYAQDKYVLPKDVTTIHQRDGFEKVRDITLAFTAEEDGRRFVRYVANKSLKAVQFQQSIEFDLDNTKKHLGLWDVFTISNSAYRLDNAMFRVDKLVTSLDDKTMITKVVASQYDASVYDNGDYEDATPSTPTPTPSNQILEPTQLAFTQTGFTVTGSGILSWVSRYQREHRTVIEYKLHSAPTWNRVGEVQVSRYEFVGLHADTYDFRVCTQTFNGSTSNWSVLQGVVITNTLTIPAVSGLSGAFSGVDALVRWDDMTQLPLGAETLAEVFSHYEVEVRKSGVYESTHRVVDNAFTYSYSMNAAGVAADRDLTFIVKMVSRDGVKSVEPATLNLSNPQCAQPSGVVVQGVLSTVYAGWDAPIETDYLGTEVHVSTDPTFTPSSKTLVGTSSGEKFPINKPKGKYYLRVGHYDVFGADGISFSTPLYFAQGSIEDELENVPTFDEMGVALAESRKQIEASVADQYATITNLNQVQESTDGKLSALTQIKHDVNGKVSGLIMGNDGDTSTFDVVADKFRVSSAAGDEAVFQVVDGKTTIKNALIKNLSADNIQAGAINGNHISSNTKVIAGQGNTSVVMDGQSNDWRLYAGNLNPTAAPFRVNKDGKLFATNADISGNINASSGSFTGKVNAKSGTFSNVLIDETCTIKGTITADKIIGDVVSSKAYKANIKDIPISSTWQNISTVGAVTNNLNEDGVAVIEGASFECRVVKGEGGAWGWGVDMRLIDEAGVVLSTATASNFMRLDGIWNDSDSTVVINQPSTTVPIPRGGRKTFTVQVRFSINAYVSSARLTPLKSYLSGQLFRSGSSWE